MDEILLVVLGGLISWWILWENIYSPKAQIKILWKQVFDVAFEIGKIHDKPGMEQIRYILNQRSNRHGRLINAILEYHFDRNDEEELRFINKYSYQEK